MTHSDLTTPASTKVAIERDGPGPPRPAIAADTERKLASALMMVMKSVEVLNAKNDDLEARLVRLERDR